MNNPNFSWITQIYSELTCHWPKFLVNDRKKFNHFGHNDKKKKLEKFCLFLSTIPKTAPLQSWKWPQNFWNNKKFHKIELHRIQFDLKVFVKKLNPTIKYLPTMCFFAAAIVQRTKLICKLCFTNKYLSQESNSQNLKKSNSQHSAVFCGSYSQLQLYFIIVSLSTKCNADRAISL